MTGEWQHQQKSSGPSNGWTQLPWVIALGFVLLWLPGAILAWQYPYGSQAQRRQARVIVCTVIVPFIGGILYLLYFLVALLVNKIGSRN